MKRSSGGDNNAQSTEQQSRRGELRVQAKAYIEEVRQRFGRKSEKFNEFIAVLRDFRNQMIDAASVGMKIGELFDGHDDLILKFHNFMPRDDDDDDDNDSEKTTPEYPVEVIQAVEFMNKVKTRFQNNQHGYEAFLQTVNQIQEGCPPPNEVAAVFKGHPDLLQEFHRMISNSYPSSSANDCDHSVNSNRENPGLVCGEHKSCKSSEYYKQLFSFCKKIKNLLCSSDYQELSKHLEDYSSGKVDRDALIVTIQELLKDKLDLVNLHDFLKSCENTEELVAIYNFIAADENLPLSDSAILEEIKNQKAKYEILEETKQQMLKPIHELDLSKCQQVSPSYWILPENYSMPTASNRSEIGDQVLNGSLVCVNSRSENYSSKQRHRTQEEEILFRCEDDMFEMDMLLTYVTSASERAEGLLKKIKDNEIKTTSMKIEDYLNVFDLRCIERLYGEHGLDMMELLHDDPALALPTISPRLKQKKEELISCRSDFDKIWAHVCVKNRCQLQEKQHEPKN